jgi:hypothetical protein
MGRSVLLAAFVASLAVIPALGATDSDGIVLSVDKSGSNLNLQWAGGSPLYSIFRSSNPAAILAPSSALAQSSSTAVTDSAPAGNILFYVVTDPTAASAQIDAARAATPGPVSLPIDGAIVTYVKPSVAAGDPTGFFLQGLPTGPGLFVAVDPSTITPTPAVGDTVRLTLTDVEDVTGLRQAVAILSYVRVFSGASVGYLLQDLTTHGDLVTSLSSYDSELARLSMTLMAPFSPSGTGYVATPIATTGMPAGDANLRFRTTPGIVDAVDLVSQCSITLSAPPLWRFNATAQPTAWLASEVTVASCPPPAVVGAIAASSTAVAVRFDRRIAAGSLNPNGSQFVFSNGLAATAAALSGPREVTVSTSTQTGGVSYTVAVASSVTDLAGTGVSPSANSANFTGYQLAAALQINEVNPNLTSSKDLVELLVTGSGSTLGFVLQQDVASPVVLATLPDIHVTAGDVIVVHLTPTPGSGEGSSSETISKAQYPSSIYTNNYDTAWDVNGNAVGITFSNRVLLLRDSLGAVQDAVVFARSTSTNSSFPPDLQSIQAMGQWLPADCGGSLCTYLSVPTATDVSADWSSVSTVKSGQSVQRTGVADTNQKADWTVKAATFGAANQ